MIPQPNAPQIPVFFILLLAIAGVCLLQTQQWSTRLGEANKERTPVRSRLRDGEFMLERKATNGMKDESRPGKKPSPDSDLSKTAILPEQPATIPPKATASSSADPMIEAPDLCTRQEVIQGRWVPEQLEKPRT